MSDILKKQAIGTKTASFMVSGDLLDKAEQILGSVTPEKKPLATEINNTFANIFADEEAGTPDNPCVPVGDVAMQGTDIADVVPAEEISPIAKAETVGAKPVEFYEQEMNKVLQNVSDAPSVETEQVAENETVATSEQVAETEQPVSDTVVLSAVPDLLDDPGVVDGARYKSFEDCEKELHELARLSMQATVKEMPVTEKQSVPEKLPVTEKQGKETKGIDLDTLFTLCAEDETDRNLWKTLKAYMGNPEHITVSAVWAAIDNCLDDRVIKRGQGDRLSKVCGKVLECAKTYCNAVDYERITGFPVKDKDCLNKHQYIESVISTIARSIMLKEDGITDFMGILDKCLESADIKRQFDKVKNYIGKATYSCIDELLMTISLCISYGYASFYELDFLISMLYALKGAFVFDNSPYLKYVCTDEFTQRLKAIKDNLSEEQGTDDEVAEQSVDEIERQGTTVEVAEQATAEEVQEQPDTEQEYESILNEGVLTEVDESLFLHPTIDGVQDELIVLVSQSENPEETLLKVLYPVLRDVFKSRPSAVLGFALNPESNAVDVLTDTVRVNSIVFNRGVVFTENTKIDKVSEALRVLQELQAGAESDKSLSAIDKQIAGIMHDIEFGIMPMDDVSYQTLHKLQQRRRIAKQEAHIMSLMRNGIDKSKLQCVCDRLRKGIKDATDYLCDQVDRVYTGHVE